MEKLFQKEFPKESTIGDMHTSDHNEQKFDVYKLIHLTREIPETNVAVNDYLSELDNPCWTDSNESKITPKEVVEIYRNDGCQKGVANRPELHSHLEGIDRADYSHPILIFESTIIDGIHRFAKAYSDGASSIEAKIITSIPEGAIIKIDKKE